MAYGFPEKMVLKEFHPQKRAATRWLPFLRTLEDVFGCRAVGKYQFSTPAPSTGIQKNRDCHREAYAVLARLGTTSYGCQIFADFSDWKRSVLSKFTTTRAVQFQESIVSKAMPMVACGLGL